MTLVKSKNKKISIAAKKRYGNHHRKVSSYNKTYWPYIPLVALIASTLFIATRIKSSATAASISSASNHTTLGVIAVVTVIFFLLAIIFLLRSFRRINKLYIKGEQILLKHYWIDFAVAIGICFCIILLAKF